MQLPERMPLLFIGHGSPMNAVANNAFTRSLTHTGTAMLPKPRAICVISAHWLSHGVWVNTTQQPETIYDFNGFPDELYQITYPAPGAPEYARRVLELLPESSEDNERGLDHGAWTVLKHLFPDADIPVFQISIDYRKPMQFHYDIAKRLAPLRDEGVLFVGSGNIVHNLQLVNFNNNDETYPWAIEFDTWVKEKIDTRDFTSLINYEQHGKTALLSVPTVDHYVPLLYCLSLAQEDEQIAYCYEGFELGSLSMRCLQIG
jgi:4,5-DOPA dioxygenase extradiol